MGNSAAYFKEVFHRPEHPSVEPESPVCAPVQNLIDPRSPSDQFNRTPIEVAGLPIKARNRMNSPNLIESLGPTARGSYLNSDDISKSPKLEEATRKLHKLRLLSDDPRSPSAGILRTPIQVDITPDGVHYKSTQEESTPTDSMITDTSLEDLVFASYDSPVTSGYKPKLSLPDPRSSSEEIVHIQNQLEDASNLLNDQTVDACVTSQSGGSESDCNTEEQDVTDNQSKRRKPVARRATSVKWNETNDDCLIRKLFPGSDSKELSMQAPPKARTPLQTVSANGITPQQILRVKQSHGINQEMGRLSGIENTPPNMFNKCETQTKNKQLQKYNTSSSWETDSTIVI